MDFRPNTNTLVINYVVTFGFVGFLLYLSLGKPTQYYYSPDYSSHAGYATGSESCAQCHVKPWAKFEERTCWTGGCHDAFDPTTGDPEAARFATAKDKIGRDKPQFGAMLAFHKKVGTSVNCSSCHPSHQLPQTGLFNAATMAHDVTERAKSAPDGAPPDPHVLRTEIFHAAAKQFTGEISCNTCHLDALEAAQVSGSTQP